MLTWLFTTVAGKENLSVRVDASTVEDIDEILWQMKLEGVKDRDTKRSDVLREAINEWVEGNESSSTAILAMPN